MPENKPVLFGSMFFKINILFLIYFSYFSLVEVISWHELAPAKSIKYTAAGMLNYGQNFLINLKKKNPNFLE